MNALFRIFGLLLLAASFRSEGTSIGGGVVNPAAASPGAAFTFAPAYPAVGQSVAFSDTTTGGPTSWSWSFGDEGTSTLQNPVHAFSTSGIFTVTLTATSGGGSGTFSQGVIVGGTGSGGTRTVGLMVNTSRAMDGYLLFSPKQNKMTYLVDNLGRIVHQWNVSQYSPGQSSYLLENGNLLRPCQTKGQLSSGGGEGGRVEEYDWDGNLVWQLDYSTATYMQHHDVRRLPNGNVLMLVVEKKSYAEAVAAGFNPARFQPEIAEKGFMLPDSIVEIKPTRPVGGTVVWEWHAWDHLVQDFDSTKANFGVVRSHPELVDAAGDQSALPAFWNHMNSVDYNPALDQIAVSVRGNSEVWIIDHSTTTLEAGGHTGGRRGKGGDLLYRWGNPVCYRSGTSADRRYYQQHDVEWVPSDCPGAGNFTSFNNGLGRGTGKASSVDEFRPAVDSNGDYPVLAGSAFGPTGFSWSYVGTTANPLYSENISGAQRLRNGNTIICSGGTGQFLEVTAAGEIAWKYVCPVDPSGPMAQGAIPPTDASHPSETMNSVFRVYKYPVDYAAFAGRTLVPGDSIEKYTSTGAPVAAFTFSPAAPAVGQSVAFRDGSTGSPTSWAWTFGDGGTSALQNPDHAWAAAGTYPVALTARNSAGSTSVSRSVAVGSASPLVEVLLPAGVFEMGDHYGFVDPSHPSDELPIHGVKVDSLFMAATTTTNRQLLDFLNDALAQKLITVRNGTVFPASGSEPYFYTHEYSSAYSIGFDGAAFSIVDFRANHPAVGVLWYGAAAYCNGLSRRSGLDECYDLTTGSCDFTKNGYRLPTEAEWEYAARGGRYTPYLNYPYGNTIDFTRANLPGSGDPYEGTDSSTYPWTTPVGFYDGTLKKKADYGWPGAAATCQTSDGANGWGLYDMQGNVWQLVNDWYGTDYYSVSPYDNPKGPDSGSTMPDGLPYRGMRGGNWYNGLVVGGVSDGHSRVSNRDPSYYRGPLDPKASWSMVGFRVARSPGTGTTSTRFLPIVLDVAGRARYVSEVSLANRGTTTATVDLLYTASSAFGGAGSGTVPVSLPAGRQLVLDDAIGFLRSSGLAIPSGSQAGTLRATFSGLSSADAAAAAVRITSPSENGRAGVSYAAPRLEELPTSSTSWLYGLRSSSLDRTNVALANASTSSSVTLRLVLSNGDGSGQKVSLPDRTLAAGQWTQLDDVFAGTGFSQGYASVAVISGSGPYYAYAVINDNGTNDGSFAPFEPDPATAEPLLLPVAVETPVFSSELVLTNRSTSARTVTLSYLESLSPSQGVGGTAVSVTETVAPGEQKVFSSLFDELRARSAAVGPKGGSYAGALSVRFTSGDSLASGYAAARTSSPARSGSGRYGLFYSAVGPSSRASSAAWVHGLRQDSSVRSNVAVAAAPENSAPISVHAELYDGMTGLLASTSPSVPLAPGAWKQWGDLLSSAGVEQGYVKIVNESSSSLPASSFVAYGVVNDGPTAASPSGTDDGAFVPGVRENGGIP